MNNGFIQLDRGIMDAPFFNKPNYLAVYIYCLLHANHKTNTFLFDNKVITIPEGSFIGSQRQIAKEFDLSISTVMRILKGLQNAGYLEVKTTTKYTYFTVIQKIDHPTNAETIDNKGRITKRNTNGTKRDHPTNAETIDNKGDAGGEFPKVDHRRITDGSPTETNNNIYNKGKKFSSIDIGNLQGIKEPIFYKNDYFFITETYKRELLTLYPALTSEDLPREFSKMEGWIGEKGKHLTNYKNFISNWLQKVKTSPSAERPKIKLTELHYV